MYTEFIQTMLHLGRHTYPGFNPTGKGKGKDPGNNDDDDDDNSTFLRREVSNCKAWDRGRQSRQREES